MENEPEVIVDPNNETEIEETPEQPLEENTPEEAPAEKAAESLEDRAIRLLRQANQARKKLGLPPLGEAKPVVKAEPEPAPSMSTKDVLAFINAKVTEDEDIAEVEEYARFKKISIAEALKSSVVKSVLAEKAEQRKTAQATNVNSKRATVKANTLDTLAEKAKEGKELSEDEIRALARAKREQLLSKNKR